MLRPQAAERTYLATWKSEGDAVRPTDRCAVKLLVLLCAGGWACLRSCTHVLLLTLLQESEKGGIMDQICAAGQEVLRTGWAASHTKGEQNAPMC